MTRATSRKVTPGSTCMIPCPGPKIESGALYHQSPPLAMIRVRPLADSDSDETGFTTIRVRRVAYLDQHAEPRALSRISPTSTASPSGVGVMSMPWNHSDQSGERCPWTRIP